MFEQNNDTGLDAYQCRSGDKPLPERRRGRPHQQPPDPPAGTFRSEVLDRSDQMLCHMIGVARAMVRRNIATEAPILLPASR
jgi:hypothetical protein